MAKNWRFTASQRAELERIAKTDHTPYVRVRALALCHLASGMEASRVADIVLAHRVSVGQWAKRYLEEGAAGLKIREGRGRPSHVEREELDRYLRQSPEVFGLDLARWTLSALAQTVPSLKGMTQAGVKKALERHGYAYKRGQPHLHSPDPDYEEKKGLWIKL